MKRLDKDLVGFSSRKHTYRDFKVSKVIYGKTRISLKSSQVKTNFDEVIKVLQLLAKHVHQFKRICNNANYC